MISFEKLQQSLKGPLYFKDEGFDHSMRMVYATDASSYQEKPVAVALPATPEDVKLLIAFATQNKLSLIPRAAGTSLAGQVVGNGIVVDASVGWDKVIEVNAAEKWARVQPGIIRDDLNHLLKPHGLMYGPETSTASRAMIGGMVGNNSCGLHSIKWGSARDHLLEAKALLSDGSECTFRALTADELAEKIKGDTAESRIYKNITSLLADEHNRQIIQANFPKKEITRRNSGYALDAMISKPVFNLCNLLAGSEGTLCFFTEFKIRLLDLPPKHNVLLCIHFSSLRECLEANVVAMRYSPYAAELTDKRILDFTKDHPLYGADRFFIEGDPEAILMVEFFADELPVAMDMVNAVIKELQSRNMGYAWPVLTGAAANRAWNIRKAGLGLLRNMPGDQQPVNLIEDCAVSVEDLPDYADGVAAILQRHGLVASYYAHAGAGELHIEPMINLKSAEGKRQFRQVLTEVAQLVKQYKGSLSGEHGDGRLRGEFIPAVMGQEVYGLFKQVKHIFDPANIFNAGKIVDTPKMDEQLRYDSKQQDKPVKTIFDFSKDNGMLALTEKCSGSGDCRKTHVSGGTMCPSFMVTRKELNTTRARANILRQYLTNAEGDNPFNHEEIKNVMDLCLSCKGCKTECPSSVDITKLKAEFLQHYYDANGVPFRTRMISNFTAINKLASVAPGLYNLFMQNRFSSGLLKKIMGFAPERSMPLLHKQTLKSWFKKWKPQQVSSGKKKVLFFADEFTDYNDVTIGQKAIMLLTSLGYDVEIPAHVESGRASLSKGLLYHAQKTACKNISLLWPVMQQGVPLVGVEPSAVLGFRDEYPSLVTPDLKEKATLVAQHSFYIDEFIAAEIAAGNITSQQFTASAKKIKLHGHCHQKALSAVSATVAALSLPANYLVEVIPSGCCGMAGSFGYEKEHYDISMKAGELVLFPAVRAAGREELIAAPGTSCRHQIKDGTGVLAKHPVEILWEALAVNN